MCVARSLTSLLRLFKICGLFACSVCNGKITRDKAIGPGLCYFWILIIAIRLSYLVNQNVNKSGDVVTLNNICLAIETFLGIFISLAALKQDQYIEFFNKLDEYDDKILPFKTNNKEPDACCIFWMSIVFVACFSLIHIGVHLLQFYYEHMKFSLHECLKVAIVTILLFNLSYSAIKINLQLFLLQRRFVYLNTILSSNALWDTNICSNVVLTGYDVQELRTLLYRVHEIFNKIYSLPFFCFSSLTTITALSLVYVENMEHIYGSSAWIMLTLLFSVCACCHITGSEANETGKIVMADKISTNNMRCLEERISVGIHLLHHRVSFSAAGCFDMNLQFYGNVMTLLLASYWLSDYPIW